MTTGRRALWLLAPRGAGVHGKSSLLSRGALPEYLGTDNTPVAGPKTLKVALFGKHFNTTQSLESRNCSRFWLEFDFGLFSRMSQLKWQ